MHLSDNALGVHYFKLIDLQNKRTNVSNLRIKEFFQVSSTELALKTRRKQVKKIIVLMQYFSLLMIYWIYIICKTDYNLFFSVATEILEF